MFGESIARNGDMLESGLAMTATHKVSQCGTALGFGAVTSLIRDSDEFAFCAKVA